jgi:hypothetical protein
MPPVLTEVIDPDYQGEIGLLGNWKVDIRKSISGYR